MTHYPRQEATLVRCCVWPLPPDRPNFKTLPKLSELNLLEKYRGQSEVLRPGEDVTWYHSALQFSRLFGSLACDQPIEFSYHFSNDEVYEKTGHWITDATLPFLNYDVVAKEGTYKPGERHTGHFMIIVGRWLRVRFKNVGDAPIKFIRAYARGIPF